MIKKEITYICIARTTVKLAGMSQCLSTLYLGHRVFIGPLMASPHHNRRAASTTSRYESSYYKDKV